MNAFDSQTEDSSPAIGRNLRSRPLARKKLSEMVEEELEQMIRRREFGEGEQLPSERELMAFFNVGRPSVREALAALKRKGLVQINNGERARVSRPSADTIIGELSGMAKDFLSHPGGIAHFEQLRLFFESSLVRYAAEHATDEQIDLLAKALEINSQSLDNNAAFIRSDVDFHRVKQVAAVQLEIVVVVAVDDDGRLADKLGDSLEDVFLIGRVAKVPLQFLV